MKLNSIAAIGLNNELGINNDLIWKLKGDMKFFKETTIGHTIIMGRKTFESLPCMLPNRKHIILTHQDIPNVEIYHSSLEFIKAYEDTDEEIFNIGGACTYKELLKYTNNIYLTEIEATSIATAYFPYFNKEEYEKQVICSNEENGIKYSHVLYKRRNI